MTPERDADGKWFIALPDGQRKEFKTNSEAWAFLDRLERRPLWVSSREQWRVPLSYALPGTSSSGGVS
jgi:hypothetical protein